MDLISNQGWVHTFSKGGVQTSPLKSQDYFVTLKPKKQGNISIKVNFKIFHTEL